MDILFWIFLPLLIISFAVQLVICFKAKSRTVCLMPAALFLLASNAWLFNLLDPRGYDTLGFGSPSLYFLFCAIACGLAWAIYGIVRLIVKLCNKKSENKESDIGIEKEPAAIKEHTQRREILAIIQIAYIVLVFLFFLMQGLDYYSYTNSLGEIILFLYVSVSVVINSIALVFVIKSIVIAVKQLIQSKQYLRLGASVVLVISVILSIWNGLVIYAASDTSNFAIYITDENREKIESLIDDANKRIYNYNDLPGLDKATKIRHINNFLDDEFEISFEYGTTYRFSVDGTIYPLGQYIHDEGYNVYLRSHDYTRDRIILASSLSVTIISAAVLAVSIKKKHGIAENVNSPAST